MTVRVNDPARRQFLKSALASTALLAASAPGRARDDLAWLSLAQAGEMARRKTVSPVELTRACLNRIEALDPVLNAFITVTAETALAEARRAEEEIGRGNWRGSLHGVPIALKDLFDTAGVKTTAASALFAQRIPDEDAEVVRRLRAAGAVFLGKLNMSEFAYSETSAFSHYGPVRNPWALERIAGGSSGGSSAAVSAGLCYGALGSDTGGSIRQPAAYCNMVGLKPTYGRVSNRGVVPLAWSLDHTGPLTRTVADSAILLQVLAGYDPDDTSTKDVPVPDYRTAIGRDVSTLRIGTPREVFYENLDPEIEAAVSGALAVLQRIVSGIQDVTLPAIPSLPILRAEAYTYHAGWLEERAELYQPQTLRSLRSGAGVTIAEYAGARRKLDELRRSVGQVFQSVDLLVTPATPLPPPRIDDVRAGRRPKGAPGLLRNTTRFNIYGLPAISIPCGFTVAGLPIGLQISGPHWDESGVLALAHAYEQATDWHNRRPAIGQESEP